MKNCKHEEYSFNANYKDFDLIMCNFCNKECKATCSICNKEIAYVYCKKKDYFTCSQCYK